MSEHSTGVLVTTARELREAAADGARSAAILAAEPTGHASPVGRLTLRSLADAVPLGFALCVAVAPDRRADRAALSAELDAVVNDLGRRHRLRILVPAGADLEAIRAQLAPGVPLGAIVMGDAGPGDLGAISATADLLMLAARDAADGAALAAASEAAWDAGIDLLLALEGSGTALLDPTGGVAGVREVFLPVGHRRAAANPPFAIPVGMGRG